MSRALFVVALFALLLSPVAAQVSAAIPDADATMGTCNTNPWGQLAGRTYIGRIPASYLCPVNPYINEISFAPCYTGSWSCSKIIMGLGHVPNPQPCPFNFPTFDASGNMLTQGSFNNMVVIYNSFVSGPFSWSWTQNAWSPMGFANPIGTAFQWNGIDDIAFFVTFEGATTTALIGGMHRTSTEPARSYATGYNAATSSTCAAASGLKMLLDVSPGPGQAPIPPWQVNQPGASLDFDGAPDPGPLVPMITNLTPGQLAFVNFSSTNLGMPWDIALTLPEPGVSACAGGTLLPGNQVVNVDISAPSLSLLFNLFLSPPFANASLPFASQTPLTLSAQLLVIDPGLPAGLAASHLNQLSVP